MNQQYLLKAIVVLGILSYSPNANAQFVIHWEDFNALEPCPQGGPCTQDLITPYCLCLRYGPSGECLERQQGAACSRNRRKLLPDGDLIDVTIQKNAVDSSIVEFVLDRGPGIDWYKQLTIYDGTGASFRIGSKDKQPPVRESLWSGQVKNGQPIRFTKAGFLGYWKDSYLLFGLERLAPGTRVTFRWVRDKWYNSATQHPY
jgi:hypothetical protein